MADFLYSFTTYDDQEEITATLQNLFDTSSCSLGLLDFLDHKSPVSTLFEWVPSTPKRPKVEYETAAVESSEVLSNPATPNSSSFSSYSIDHSSEQLKIQDKNIHLKSPRLNMKKEPKFAFITKTDFDQLDDGFRWRKYGQKPVKNSPYPRSYFRCTSRDCGVKKRVERSSDDSTLVITTYEGKHRHICPVRRGNIGAIPRCHGESSSAKFQLEQESDNRFIMYPISTFQVFFKNKDIN